MFVLGFLPCDPNDQHECFEKLHPGENFQSQKTNLPYRMCGHAGIHAMHAKTVQSGFIHVTL